MPLSKFFLNRLIVGLIVPGWIACAQNPASTDYFETKVRPILAANCYGCHTNSQMGGLRVDSSETLRKGGKSGPAIVPGDPDKSLLIKRVREADPQRRMPMGGKLKDSDVETLAVWIKAGAAWPLEARSAMATKTDGYVIHAEQRNFWSFQPLKNPELPAVKNPKWAKTPIDRFILARLEKENLQPAKFASRRDLIRRASLDLTGLPPAPDEIEAFEKDPREDAFTKVVDRLLASPHYGERWGRMWLDVARYGEDDYRSLDPMRRGYNPYPNAYLYRDWVVQAFNDDLPYSQFVKDQIAGDLLDQKERYRTIAATGFFGLGPWYYDNGAVEVTRADERHDRVDAVSRGFLGLTVACARCHDHKYDPIPQTDYYSLAGVFLNTKYEEYPLVPENVVKKYEDTLDAIDTRQKLLMETQNNLASQLARTLALQTSNYLVGVWQVTGKPKQDIAKVVEDRKLDYELLVRWIHYMERTTERYKAKDPWQAMIKKGGTASEAKKLADQFQEQVVSVMLERAGIDDENKVISDKALEGTKAKKRRNKPSDFVTNDDFCPGCGLQLKSMAEDRNYLWTEIFQREINDNDDPTAMLAMGTRSNPGVLLFRGWGLESRIGAEGREQIASIRKDIEAQKKTIEPFFPYVHGITEQAEIHDLPVALRGNPMNPGKEVPRHFLSVLSPGDPKPFTKGSGRLELAEDIIAQPLAMRVIVNRIWRGHFGTGIVETPSNFGTTGERPVHPELLEYLASSFVKNGMSIKQLHREIMLSSVYQLSTDNNEAAMQKDAGNRLYWRANRHRLDAEQVRDSVLFVAGNLDDSLGGPSKDLSPAYTRRTIYGKVSRYKLDQYLQLFDFPNPSISAERRFTTTVPLQRLFLMNSDFMQLEAEQLVKRIAAEPGNVARIRKAYRIVFGRVPSDQEVQIGLAYLKSEPALEYEEGKKKEKHPPEPKLKDLKDDPVLSTTNTILGKPAAAEEIAPSTEDAAVAPEMPGEAGGNIPMGMGMMKGVMPAAGGSKGVAAAPEYEAMAWGRYIKVLLSSSEFLFVN